MDSEAMREAHGRRMSVDPTCESSSYSVELSALHETIANEMNIAEGRLAEIRARSGK